MEINEVCSSLTLPALLVIPFSFPFFFVFLYYIKQHYNISFGGGGNMVHSGV